MNRVLRLVTMTSAAIAAATAFALDDIAVPAPGRVGDVVALTNALARVQAGAARHVLLAPGVYDLAGVKMTSGSHLQLTFTDKVAHMMSGTGTNPGDTILKGGGEADNCRVIAMEGTGWRYATLSNLTVTGGYTTGNGGGIAGHASARVIDCVVSNNFAYGAKNNGGGGMFKGSAIRCLFADNVAGRDNTETVHGGGMWCNGDVTAGGLYQQVVDCVFSNNWCRNNGGACYGNVPVSGCTFVGNTAANGGGLYSSGASGYGPISNCVFRMNAATSEGCAVASASLSYGTTVVRSELSENTNGTASAGWFVNFRDSVITNHCGKRKVLLNCNLYGCLIADNTVSNTVNATYGIDYLESDYACTNANCIFRDNDVSGASSVRITAGKKVVINCTYVGNVVGNGNYGHIIDSGAVAYNTVYLDNLVGSRSNFNKDLGHPSLTNCTYSAAGGAVEDLPRCSGVFKATRAELKFSTKDASRPYVPSRKSPLRNAAYSEPWILTAVGAKDVYGEPRVFEGMLDIGAAECVEPPSGMVLLFR